MREDSVETGLGLFIGLPWVEWNGRSFRTWLDGAPTGSGPPPPGQDDNPHAHVLY